LRGKGEEGPPPFPEEERALAVKNQEVVVRKREERKDRVKNKKGIWEKGVCIA